MADRPTVSSIEELVLVADAIARAGGPPPACIQPCTAHPGRLYIELQTPDDCGRMWFCVEHDLDELLERLPPTLAEARAMMGAS